VSSKRASSVIFLLAFTALLVAIHLPYLKLPFFWDEMGQFVPAALDLYHDGAWVPHSAIPNVHPPGLMAILAVVWRLFGFSIASARLTMLLIASAGVLFSFLLAIRLARGTAGAPALAAVLFLMAAPIFYTQSMMVLLDMPAMTFTVLALLLFLDGRYRACAIACTALVLIKETAISTPFVFAAWLWFREKRRREALYFAGPALAVGAWLMVLKHATGHLFGNPEFARYNIDESLTLVHIAAALGRRLYFLFVGDGHFIGAFAIFAGWRVLKGKDWTIAALVAAAQLLVVTVFGGATLDRYVMPVLPTVYAAMAAAACVYPSSWRWTSHSVMIGLFVLGWFWNPPYPFPYENNLAMTDFVSLQREAASYLEAYAPDQHIASAWPFSEAVRHPEFGYVSRPLQTEQIPGFHPADLANLDRNKVDVLVVFSRTWSVEGRALDIRLFRDFLRNYYDYHPQASSEEIRAGLGYVLVKRWTRGGQFIEIYLPER